MPRMKITLEGVSKKFGKVHALQEVTLCIEPGQIVGLIGPNGAGKTTLLRCLAGILVADRGRILYDGEPLRRDRLDLRRRFHFLPDFPIFLPAQTMVRHIGMALRLYQADDDGSAERVLELLRDLDLLPLAEALLGTLSRGQLYKAALASLMAVNPEVWLLDEPFASGMDPHGITVLRHRARAAAQQGRTVIFSTQLLDVVERFADRVCVIHHGKVRAFDTLPALRERVGREHGVLEDLFAQFHEEDL
jgi:ABC-type multidrug transport system ATPase subunit